MKELVEIVHRFVVDRPVMARNNACPENAVKLLRDEVDELTEEVLKGDVTHIRREVPDVLWMLINLSLLYDIDIEAEFRDKAARNILKRPASEWQSGDYNAIDANCRARWSDEEYYQDERADQE